MACSVAGGIGASANPVGNPPITCDTVRRGPAGEGGDQRAAVARTDLFGRRMGWRCRRQHRAAGRGEFGGMADVIAPRVGRAGHLGARIVEVCEQQCGLDRPHQRGAQIEREQRGEPALGAK